MSKEFLKKLESFAAELRAESLDDRRARLATVEQRLSEASIACNAGIAGTYESVMFHSAFEWGVNLTPQPRLEENAFPEINLSPPDFRKFEAASTTPADTDAGVSILEAI